METGNRQTRLQKLSNSNFEIADGERDIRGWDVKDSSGKKLGKVDELIFDYESQKIRYLVVDLDHNDYDMDDRQVLVPIGIAEFSTTEDDVILPGVTPDQLLALPEYDDERFDTEHEESVRNVFGGLGESALNGGSDKDTDFYNHDHFKDDLYRNRNQVITEFENAGTLMPGQSINEYQQINPGGVRLRSRGSGITDLEETDTRKTTSTDKDDKFGEYPVM